jgi:hypothetical protein
MLAAFAGLVHHSQRATAMTLFRGPGMGLDVFNGGANDNQPHIVRCYNFTGPLWSLTKTDKRMEGGPRPPESHRNRSRHQRPHEHSSLFVSRPSLERRPFNEVMSRG